MPDAAPTAQTGPGAGPVDALRVFVTVGNPTQAFDRMVQTVDDGLAELRRRHPEVKLTGRFQFGHCTRTPTELEPVAFLDRAQFDQELEQADVVICHGGVGSIRGATQKGHVPLVMARRPERGEHIHDALPVTEAVARTLGTIVHVVTVEDLVEGLERFVAGTLARGAARPDFPAESELAPVRAAMTEAPTTPWLGPLGRPILRVLGLLGPPLDRMRQD